MASIDVTLVKDGSNVSGSILKSSVVSYWDSGSNLMVELSSGNIHEVYQMDKDSFKNSLDSGFWGMLWG